MSGAGGADVKKFGESCQAALLLARYSSWYRKIYCFIHALSTDDAPLTFALCGLGLRSLSCVLPPHGLLFPSPVANLPAEANMLEQLQTWWQNTGPETQGYIQEGSWLVVAL